METVIFLGVIMNTEISKFVPISKIDEDERMVYGFASTPDLDSQGEVVTVEAIKRALPDYLKFPTIREMHQPNAVGTTKTTKISDKGLEIGAKIVDDTAWKKVKEGVFRGFSIGGSVLDMVGNTIKNMALTEISLVDVPANKQAVITLFKADTPEMALRKSLDEMPEMNVEENEVYNAQFILGTVSDLFYVKAMREVEGKSTKLVDRAIKALRELATKVLEGEDKKKFDKFFEPADTYKAEYLKMLKGYKLKPFGGEVESLEKAKKKEEVVEETVEETVEDTVEDTVEETVKEEDTEEAVEETVEEPEVAEEPEAPEGVEVDHAKQVSDEATDIEKNLAKLDNMEKKEEIEKVDQLAKLDKAISKVVEILERHEEILAKVEKMPKGTKSKASYLVSKAIGGADTAETSPELEKLQARANELAKIRETNLSKYETDNLAVEAIQVSDAIKALKN